MKAPQRRRPPRRAIGPPPVGADLRALAPQAKYVGSGEHKSYPSFAGPPRLRRDTATKCDPSFTDPEPITAWLRAAIESGHVGGPWEGRFPRYVWSRRGETVYEGRLVNREQGECKGYGLEEGEWPAGLE